MIRSACSVSTALLLPLLGLPVVAADPLPRAEVAKIGKAGTALVEVRPLGIGSGFCVHPSGLFVTSEHVFANGGTEAAFVVVDAGQVTQKVLKASVVRRDKNLGLVLLRVEGDHKLPALALGSDVGLTELTELVALGFPSGTPYVARAVGAEGKPDQYPGVTANVVNVTSVPTNANREMDLIQIDTKLNFANAGGPVLDRTGKVVGVVSSREFGGDSNTAIPVRSVRRFLEPPDVTFIPPTLARGTNDKPIEFRAMVMPLLFDVTSEVEVVLSLTSPGGNERKFPMKKVGNAYTTSAVPYLGALPVPTVRVEATFPDGAVRGATPDGEFKVGSQVLKLSEVRSIRPADKAVERLNGARLAGDVNGLSVVPVQLGSQRVKLDLGMAIEVTVRAAPEQSALRCVLVVRQGGREVGRLFRNLYAEGTPLPSLAAIREGKFHQPPLAPATTSYLRFQNITKDNAGLGKVYEYDGKDLNAFSSGRYVRVSGAELTINFESPQKMRIGEYSNAKRWPARSGESSPAIGFSGRGRLSAMSGGGHFVIWELEVNGHDVSRLAIDFISQGDGGWAGQVGMIRINSTLE